MEPAWIFMLVNRVGCVTNCVKRQKEVVGDLTLNLSCVYNSRECESREWMGHVGFFWSYCLVEGEGGFVIFV